MRMLEPTKPKHTFDDLMLPAGDNGRPSVADRLREIKDEFDARDWLRKYGDGLRPRNRLLFCGPPGNGKTACAHAVAHHMGYEILCVNYAELLSQYMSATAKNLGSAFEQVRGRKCVLFFDECDTLLTARLGGRSGGEVDHNQTANVALTELDRLDPETLFIGATNLSDNLDRAIIRRLGEPINFPPPTPEQRAAFIERRIAAMKVFRPAANAELARAVSAPSFAELKERVDELARQLIIATKRREDDAQKKNSQVAAKAASGQKPQAAAGQKEKGSAKAAANQGRRRRGATGRAGRGRGR